MKEEWVQMFGHMQQLRRFSRKMVIHRRLPVTISELELLSCLWVGREPMTPLHITRCMELQQMNVSRLIRTLREKGLVEGIPSKEDKRSYALRITEKGRQALETCCQAYLKPLYELRNCLGQAVFDDLMGHIRLANGVIHQKEENLER